MVDLATFVVLFGVGLLFLYAGLFSPDSTIEKFRRPALFESPPEARRIAYRTVFVFIGLTLVWLCLEWIVP